MGSGDFSRQVYIERRPDLAVARFNGSLVLNTAPGATESIIIYSPTGTYSKMRIVSVYLSGAPSGQAVPATLGTYELWYGLSVGVASLSRAVYAFNKTADFSYGDWQNGPTSKMPNDVTAQMLMGRDIVFTPTVGFKFSFINIDMDVPCTRTLVYDFVVEKQVV